MAPVNENKNEKKENSKKRHGCVTAWLVMMLIANSMAALINIFDIGNLSQGGSTVLVQLLGVIGLANVIFAVMLLRWKKSGFWGFAITSILTAIINLIIGIGIFYSIAGLIGIALLFGILQFESNGTSAWENLE